MHRQTAGALRRGMTRTRTMWLVVFCLIGLGAAIAIKAATPGLYSIAARSQEQNEPTPAFTLNEAAKSDRLKLPDAGGETEAIAPTTTSMPAEPPSTVTKSTKTTTIPHWREANAKVVTATSLRHAKRKQAENRAKTKKRPIERAANSPAHVFHCRQDAVGGLLRALDLSPRCEL